VTPESSDRWIHARKEETTMSDANKQLSRRFTELFTTGDPDRADEVLSRDVVFHGPTGIGDLRGLAEMKRLVAAYHAAFPDA
jgi:SnoaL-like protein